MTNLQQRVDEVDPGGISLYGAAVSLTPAAVVSLGSMEGLPDNSKEAVGSGATTHPVIVGVLLALVVTVAAYTVRRVPVWPITIDGQAQLSAALLAVVLGLAVRNLFVLPPALSMGTKLVVKRLIPIAIVCIGAGLDFGQLRGAGPVALGVMTACVVVAYLAAYLIGRLVGLPQKTAILLGVGTGICGSSAIVAAAPLIEADDEDVVLSVGTVNLLGLLAMLALPALAVAVGMDARSFGVWCGAAIHAVPQVLGAADAHPTDPAIAVEWATLIKLARVVLLAPLVVLLAVAYARRRSPGDDDAPRIHLARLVPWYIWGFLAFALLNTLGWLPAVSATVHLAGGAHSGDIAAADMLGRLGKLLLIIALAGIGLEVRLKKLLSVGGRAIAAGLASTVVLAAVAYMLIVLLLG